MRANFLQALLLSVLAAVAFLRDGLRPGTTVLPFPPENVAAIGAGRQLAAADLLRGNPSGGDKLNQSLTWDRISRDRMRAGELPLWTHDIGGGAAFVPQMGQVYQPWTWLLPWADDSCALYGVWFFLHQVLLFLLTWEFLRRSGLQQGACLLGATALAIGLWTQARIHHHVILSAAVPGIGALVCIHALIRGGGGLLATALLALCIGSAWSGGFAPVALQASYLAAAYTVFLALGQLRGARLAALWRPLPALLLGVLLACPQMLPVLQAAGDTARGVPEDFHLARDSLDAAHLLSLVWPDLLNWPQAAYYLDAFQQTRPSFASLALLDLDAANRGNYIESAFAVGLAALSLLPLAFDRGPHRRLALLFGGVLVLALGLACAAPGFLTLSRLLPGARSGDLRRFLFLVSVALAMLAAIGADRALGARARASLFAPSLLLALVALLSGGLLVAHLAPAITVQDAWARLALQRYPDAGVTLEQFRALAFPAEAGVNRSRLLLTFLRALLVATTAWLLLRGGARRSHPLAIAWALALLTIAELAHAGTGTIVAVERDRIITPPAVLQPAFAATAAAAESGQPRPRFHRLHVRAQPQPGLLPPNLGAFYGLEDLAAYNPLPPRRLEELHLAIEPDRDGKPSVASAGAGVGALHDPDSLRHPLLDVLGLRFVLTNAALPEQQAAQLQLLDRTPAALPADGPRLYERAGAAPRATFHTRVLVIADREQRLRTLADPRHPATQTVILEDRSAKRPPAEEPDVEHDIRIARWDDEHIALDVRCAAAGYLRIAEPWDAGWIAAVDGNAQPIHIADHYLRAVWLDAGAHHVELSYRGPSVLWPRWLGLLGVVLTAAVTLAAALRRWRRQPVGGAA